MNRITKTSADRFDNIDLIKFWGMLFVIMYHTSTVNSNIYDDPSILTYFHYLVRPILSTCVPLFFFVNGFLLIKKEFQLKKHLLTMARYILLTVIWGVINILCLMPIENEWLSLKEILRALWTWKSGWIHHLWYMGALICVYFFFPLIKTAFDNHKAVFNYWVIACCILSFGNTLLCMGATTVNYFILGKEQYFTSNFFNMFNPFRAIYAHPFAYFSIGCLIGGNQEEIQNRIRQTKYINNVTLSLLLVISTVSLGLWGVFGSKVSGCILDIVWNGYDTIFTVLNVLIIYQFSTNYVSKGNLVNRYIRSVSSNTLGIFFVHMIFIQLFDRLGVNSVPFISTLWGNLLYAFAILSLCMLISRMIKRIPVLKRLV